MTTGHAQRTREPGKPRQGHSDSCTRHAASTPALATRCLHDNVRCMSCADATCCYRQKTNGDNRTLQSVPSKGTRHERPLATATAEGRRTYLRKGGGGVPEVEQGPSPMWVVPALALLLSSARQHDAAQPPCGSPAHSTNHSARVLPSLHPCHWNLLLKQLLLIQPVTVRAGMSAFRLSSLM